MVKIELHKNIPTTFSMQFVTWNGLQQAQITELTETMVSVSTLQTNDQQQSFRPLVYSHCWLFLGWSCPSNCSGLVSDGRCFWISDDTPEEHQISWVRGPVWRFDGSVNCRMANVHRSVRWCTVLRWLVDGNLCWTFWYKNLHCAANGCKFIVCKSSCGFFLEHPVYILWYGHVVSQLESAELWRWVTESI